jgi:hypothetical protein
MPALPQRYLLTIGYLEPDAFVKLVEALLTAHDFRVERPTSWVGTMYSTCRTSRRAPSGA